jgi:Cd2+/Zn2+-exporting ATPase
MKKKKLNLRDIKQNPKPEHNQDDGHNHNGKTNNLKLLS